MTNDYGLWTIYCRINSVVKAHSKSKAGFYSSVSISRLALISSEIPVSVDNCVQETQAANFLANDFTIWRKLLLEVFAWLPGVGKTEFS